MLHEQTLNLLQTLRLYGMAKGFNDRMALAASAELSHADFIAGLAHDERAWRDNARLTALLRHAKLRQNATFEDVNWRHPRGLHKQTLLQLADPAWIAAARNVLITGPTGIGKSYLACALGNLAARAGLSVLYLRTSRLFDMLLQSRADGSHSRAFKKLAKVKVLILDDFLLTPPSDEQRKDLLDVLEDRYGSGATILTSQLPPRAWHAALGDPTLADAICDRLLHNAYKIELQGQSLRKTMTQDSDIEVPASLHTEIKKRKSPANN
jgi:DNA replication protein DnaC